MSDDRTTVRYGFYRVCEACTREFHSDNSYRKVEIHEEGHTPQAAKYFICDDCTSKLLGDIEAEFPV
jgi:hypothetical protein